MPKDNTENISDNPDNERLEDPPLDIILKGQKNTKYISR